ncbi:MAG: response regulator [Myxococcaceae bacterium]
MDGNGSEGWILVAEDDALVRQAMVELLMQQGYRVQATTDGAAALELLHRSRAAPPRVLITDLDMPKLNGSDLITVLRNDPSYASLPVIVISSFEGGALPLFQVERMLAKPVRPDTLLHVVSELLAVRVLI